jgi:hypothetical protein
VALKLPSFVPFHFFIVTSCFYLIVRLWIGVVAHACNSSTPEAEQENGEFEASLEYIGTPYLKSSNKLGAVTHTCNLSCSRGRDQED